MGVSDNTGTCVECGKEATVMCISCNSAKICSKSKHLDVHLIKCRYPRLYELLETEEKISKISKLIKDKLDKDTYEFLTDINNKLFLFLPTNEAMLIYFSSNNPFDAELIRDHVVDCNDPENLSNIKTFYENLEKKIKEKKKEVKNEITQYNEEMKKHKESEKMEKMRDYEESSVNEKEVSEEMELKSLNKKIIKFVLIKKILLMKRMYVKNGKHYHDFSMNFMYAIKCNNAIVTNQIKIDKYGKIFCIDEILNFDKFKK